MLLQINTNQNSVYAYKNKKTLLCAPPAAILTSEIKKLGEGNLSLINTPYIFTNITITFLQKKRGEKIGFAITKAKTEHLINNIIPFTLKRTPRKILKKEKYSVLTDINSKGTWAPYCTTPSLNPDFLGNLELRICI